MTRALLIAAVMLAALIPTLLAIGDHEPDPALGTSTHHAATSPAYTPPPSPAEAGTINLGPHFLELVDATRPRPAPHKHARPTRPAATVATGNVWDRLAACESHGQWNIHTGNGYSGGLQMDAQFWASYGGPAYAPAPWQATRAQQITVAERARLTRGYTPWPTCARKLGLI